MRKIVSISIMRTYESCERTRYFVELRTDEGFEMTPNCHETGSVYTDGKGLSIEEARDRALIDAYNWSDFLGVPVTPYVEDGIVHEPTMTFDFYETRREDARERASNA